MWIKTEDGKLINVDKVSYFSIEKYLYINKTVTCVVAHINSDDICLITFEKKEENTKEINKQGNEIINNIIEAIEENFLEVIDMNDYK